MKNLIVVSTIGASAACLLALACAAPPSAPAKDAWHLVPIPDTWKTAPTGKLAARDGFAWYRCLVKVPASWKDRNLDLFVEPVDDARAVYFNGVQVGAAGTFPPRYRSGLGEPSRHKVARRLVRPGAYNLVAVRVYYSDGRSNFSVAAPVLLCDREAVRLEGKWQARPGDDAAWAAAPVKPADAGGAVFETVDRVDDIDRYVRRRKGDHDPYPPAESLKRFRVLADLTIALAVGEPEVRQPLSLSFDERGRLWVMQYLQYPDPAGLKMISRDQHLRTVWDRVPPPPPYTRPEDRAFRGADKITIHEDTRGNGVFDKHTTFVDGLNIATSCARGRGGVWVLNPPYLLFYADRNNDDVPDGAPEVHLEGFGLEDTHSVTNSLRWGPDGWLYATQGSTVTGHVKRPGDKEAVHSMGQLVWRYHPETKRYEIFAEGGGNAFGLEFDARGRIYSGYNGGDTRGFHYVQGGYYQKGFTKHGSLSNPYAFGYFPAMKHHSVPRFTHTFLIYEEEKLPEPYRGKLFGVEPLQGQVVLSAVMRDGSSFRTRDLSRVVTTSDQWFRPVDIKTGPDGAIYIADLYEQRIDHSSHYAGRIDRSNGRVYRLGGKGAARLKPFDYAKWSSRDLVGLLSHPGKWHRQTALRLLGDRKDKAIVPLLLSTIEKQTGQLALEALWALNLSGGLSDTVALKTLDHADPYVRLWTARLLGDRRTVSPSVARKLAERARAETDVEVRSQLACSARRLPARDALPIVRNLLGHDEDVADIHLPLLLWWAVESKVSSEPEAVLALFRDRAIWGLPLVRQHISERLMRRFARAGTRKDLLVCARLLKLAPGAEHVKRLMAGFEQAYQGRSLADLPDELVKEMGRAGGGSPALRLRQGDEKATAEALRAIGDEKADRKQRLQYVQIFGEVRQPRCVPLLLGVVEKSRDEALRRAALTALQSYPDARIGTAVVRLYGQLPEDVRSVAQTLLASRKSWALELLQAVQSGKIDRAAVPAVAVRKILLHADKQLTTLVHKLWGDVQGATTAEMRQRIERLTKVIQSGSGNPYSGRKLYANNCGKCHTLFGQGGQVGPDLTAYQRTDLDRLLVNVVNPSAEIREGFETFVVETKNGRVVNGFLADQDNRVVVLRGVDGQNLIIPRTEIEAMKKSDRSVMPEETLKDLTDQQVRDLFAYLRSSQPLP